MILLLQCNPAYISPNQPPLLLHLMTAFSSLPCCSDVFYRHISTSQCPPCFFDTNQEFVLWAPTFVVSADAISFIQSSIHLSPSKSACSSSSSSFAQASTSADPWVFLSIEAKHVVDIASFCDESIFFGSSNLFIMPPGTQLKADLVSTADNSMTIIQCHETNDPVLYGIFEIDHMHENLEIVSEHHDSTDFPNWYSEMFGHFEFKNFDRERAQFEVLNDCTPDAVLISKCNQVKFHLGLFETPTLAELSHRTHHRSLQELKSLVGGVRFANLDGDARLLHMRKDNHGAVFQVASQFNLLEMVSFDVEPEAGVTIYQHDRTQGPVCAMACPAALVYRNYLCQGGRGQCAAAGQLNMLDQVANVVGNDAENYWTVLNGYAMPNNSVSIGPLSKKLEEDEDFAEAVRMNLKVGVHWETQVMNLQHRVCQVYCSALPISYTNTPSHLWRGFATNILKSSMESTLRVASCLALKRKQRVKVYLTSLGGGVFGNDLQWIADAIDDALETLIDAPLDVFLVHFRTSNPPKPFRALETKWRRYADE